MSENLKHPLDDLLRTERLPHIWCPGCGIGTVVSCMLKAIKDSGLPLDKFCIVSGIGCTGRAPGYLKFDTYHTTHGRAIPFATGLKLANPELNVVIISGDGDLFAIGGNHLIHAARRNIDMTVICVNNFNYGMTGGQVGPTTPIGGRTTTSPYGNFEYPFNLCWVTAACGAVYVARWTTAHPLQLVKSIKEAILKKGFTFVEVISQCPTCYGRRNKMPQGVEWIKLFRKISVIKHGADPKETDLTSDKIVCGKFVDIERKTFEERLKEGVK